MKGGRCVMIKRRNSLLGSLNWATKGLVGEIRRIEQFSEQFIRGILNHLHLFEDDLLFALQILLIKPRVGEHVAEQIKSLCQSVVRNLYGKPGHLMSCVGI